MWHKFRRYALLPTMAAIMFSAGYAGASFAGSIFGRNYDTWADGNGYFLNKVGSCPVSGRDDVMPGGISSSINSATEFIDAIESPLHGTNAQKKTGASFIIQTMIGNGQGGTSSTRFNPPSASQITDFEQRVRYAAAKGRIQYNKSFTFSLNTCYQGNATSNNDDMFWDEIASGYGTQTGTGIKFLNSSGGVAYEIQWSCANPLGVISGIPDAPDYVITGRTTVSSPTVYPGGSVTFQSFLKDTGTSAASNINWTTKDGNTNATIDSGTDSSIAANSENDESDEVVNVPANTPFGTQYCRYISFNPATYGYGSGTGSTVCTTVVANFDITPTVTASSATASQNDLITFNYNVVNAGPTTTTPLTCQAAGATNGPGYTPLPQQDTTRTPLISPQPTFNCNQQFPVGTTNVATEIFDVGSAAIGSSICRSLVVNPKDDTGGSRAGAETCVVVAKAPYVQFMGNDVWAGGGFSAVNPLCNTASKIQTVSHALRDGTNAGSSVEYGAFALGQIINFGSANKALVNVAGPAGEQLTFSNANTSNLGNFGAAQHCITDYVTQYTKSAKDPVPAGNAIDVSTKPSGTQLDIVSGSPISFSSSTGFMPTGAQQIYLIEGDVAITSDIKYPATYTSVNDIPSLIIIATGNITVSRAVQQMDGVYIARGQFYTCDVALGVTLTVNPPCEKQLVINGAAVAGQFQLLRTYGADGSNDTVRKNAAEVFNFSPELYIRNALTGNGVNVLRTVNEQGLPPRF